MAADETGQEKTLEPTQEKLRKAREKGQFARSKDVTTAFSFVIVLLFLYFFQDYMTSRMRTTTAMFLRFDTFIDFIDPASFPAFAIIVLNRLLPVILPILAIVFVAGLLGEIAQIGFQTRKDPFEPNWGKLDPIKGLKNKFSIRQFAEGVKSCVKLTVFAILTFVTIRGEMPRIASMTFNQPAQGLDIMFAIGLKLAISTCIALLFFAGFDYLFQRKQYMKTNRMTHQEMKEERKQQEGDPILKARIRAIQMEMRRKRMMQDVPESDVVVTNPAHYAVALKYDTAKGFAPVVTAKGQNFLAAKIREIAQNAGVPIVENPILARALYRQAEVGKAIPAALFKAVAQILASIYMLSRARGKTWAAAAGPALS